MFRAAIKLFHLEGVQNLTERKIVTDAGLDPEAFFGNFNNKEDFIRQTVEFNLEEQKQQELAVLNRAENPVEQIILMCRHCISHLENVHPSYFVQIQYLYPLAWQAYMRHSQMHLYFTFYELVNQSINQGFIRGDINMEIVTKVLIEQINIMYNTHLFPTHRYNLDEVFRNIFYFYLKGISTDKGITILKNAFANQIM